MLCLAFLARSHQCCVSSRVWKRHVYFAILLSSDTNVCPGQELTELYTQPLQLPCSAVIVHGQPVYVKDVAKRSLLELLARLGRVEQVTTAKTNRVNVDGMRGLRHDGMRCVCCMSSSEAAVALPDAFLVPNARRQLASLCMILSGIRAPLNASGQESSAVQCVCLTCKPLLSVQVQVLTEDNKTVTKGRVLSASLVMRAGLQVTFHPSHPPRAHRALWDLCPKLTSRSVRPGFGAQRLDPRHQSASQPPESPHPRAVRVAPARYQNKRFVRGSTMVSDGRF